MSLERQLADIVEAAVQQAVQPLREDLARLHQRLAERPRPSGDEYLSTKEAAELLGLSPKTIRGWLASGVLTPHGTSHALRVSRAELEAIRPDMAGRPGGRSRAELEAEVDARADEMVAARRRREKRRGKESA